MRAIEELAEVFWTNCNHQWQTDGRPDRITPADPIPETEDAVAFDTECRDFLKGGGNRREMMLDGAFTELVGDKLAGCCRIRHRLDRRERLRSDDEKGRFRVDQLQRIGNVRTVDVGNEMRAWAIVEWSQCQRRHHWAEIGAANADIDDVGDFLAGRTFEKARADCIGKLAHRRQNAVDVRHHVLAVDQHWRVRTVAQCGMKNGTVFGEVDGLAGKHFFALGFNAAFDCQLLKQCNDVVVHGALRIVHQQVIEFCAETAESLVVGRKGGTKIGCGSAARRCFQFFDDGLHFMLLGSVEG